ncbi:hypothetical protein QCA50_017390 [Cerrena zonata]|uniref:Uncharacterized protein n=1 Tax=Cerrena zonata TaxID=2478898 RepID=A0AAW0FFG5_9APHY
MDQACLISLLNSRQRTVSVNTPVDPNTPWSWPTWQKRTGLLNPLGKLSLLPRNIPLAGQSENAVWSNVTLTHSARSVHVQNAWSSAELKVITPPKAENFTHQAINLSFKREMETRGRYASLFSGLKKTFESILADHGSRNLPEIFEEDLGEVKDLIAGQHIWGERQEARIV